MSGSICAAQYAPRRWPLAFTIAGLTKTTHYSDNIILRMAMDRERNWPCNAIAMAAMISAMATPASAVDGTRSWPVMPVYQPPLESHAHNSANIHIWRRPEPEPVVIAVARDGAERGDGSVAHPFRTIARAQQAVRQLNAAHTVTVKLGDGIYRLDTPLIFEAADEEAKRSSLRTRAGDGR